MSLRQLGDAFIIYFTSVVLLICFCNIVEPSLVLFTLGFVCVLDMWRTASYELGNYITILSSTKTLVTNTWAVAVVALFWTAKPF